jgi:hypothetical protein
MMGLSKQLYPWLPAISTMSGVWYFLTEDTWSPGSLAAGAPVTQIK